MIQIETNGKTECTVTGHAGDAEMGKDIVCAAISALFGTLVVAVDGDSKVSVLDGKIRAAPTANNLALFRAFAMGCQEIARQYPEYVRDHPRECGGQATFQFRPLLLRRITPVNAGTSVYLLLAYLLTEDHPR